MTSLRNWLSLVEAYYETSEDDPLVQRRREDPYGAPYDETDAVVAPYMEGRCYAMAVAHNRRFGWPIYALGASEDDFAEFGAETEFFHGMVMHPSGALIDVTGPHAPHDIETVYGTSFFKIGNESDLLPLLNSFMKKETLAAVEDAEAVITNYLRPKYPALYTSSRK